MVPRLLNPTVNTIKILETLTENFFSLVWHNCVLAEGRICYWSSETRLRTFSFHPSIFNVPFSAQTVSPFSWSSFFLSELVFFLSSSRDLFLVLTPMSRVIGKTTMIPVSLLRRLFFFQIPLHTDSRPACLRNPHYPSLRPLRRFLFQAALSEFPCRF